MILTKHSHEQGLCVYYTSNRDKTKSWIDFKYFIFSGGEVQVSLDSSNSHGLEHCNGIYIDARIRNSDDVMTLLMLTDALRRMVSVNTPIHLQIPYIPYARQDRVCNFGEAL